MLFFVFVHNRLLGLFLESLTENFMWFCTCKIQGLRNKNKPCIVVTEANFSLILSVFNTKGVRKGKSMLSVVGKISGFVWLCFVGFF